MEFFKHIPPRQVFIAVTTVITALSLYWNSTAKNGIMAEDNTSVDDTSDEDGNATNPELQNNLTSARELEICASSNDFSRATKAFDRPLALWNKGKLYRDDIAEIYRHLPALFEKCKKLEYTPLGRIYADMRLALFVLGNNKLEDFFSQEHSEKSMFNAMLEYLSGNESVPSEQYLEELHVSSLKATEMMVEWAKVREPLTSETLLLWNNLLLSGVVDNRGFPLETRFRKKGDEAFAGYFILPNGADAESSMDDKLADIESEFGELHPVEWSTKLMLAVLSVHPFMYDNERMARLCYAYGLVRHGVPCAVVFSDWSENERGHFQYALQKGQGQKAAKDVTYLNSMGLAGLFATLQNFASYCGNEETCIISRRPGAVHKKDFLNYFKRLTGVDSPATKKHNKYYIIH